MNELISILLTDDDEELTAFMTESLSQYEDIRVVGVAKDGIEAIEKIEQQKPDVVILDIVMPNLDGIGLLERVKDMKLPKKPIFLILSAIGHEYLVQRAIELGAEYFLLKPFNTEILLTRIRQLFRDKLLLSYISKADRADDDIAKHSKQCTCYDVVLMNTLKNIGIKPGASGYVFLKEAVIQTIKNRQRTLPITKELYPFIANKFNTSTQKVERTIRNAIDNAWLKGDIINYFPVYAKSKPTNSEFIARLAEKLKLET